MERWRGGEGEDWNHLLGCDLNLKERCLHLQLLWFLLCSIYGAWDNFNAFLKLLCFLSCPGQLHCNIYLNIYRIKCLKKVKGRTFLCLTFSRLITAYIKKFIRHHEERVRSSLGVDVYINPADSLFFPGIVNGHTRSCRDAWWEQIAHPKQTEFIDPVGSFSAWYELFTYLASAFGRGFFLAR